MTPKTLQQAIQHFSDENVCIDTVAFMRWPDGKPTCAKCESREHYYLASQKRWKCKKCAHQFSVKVGTIFEDSAVPLCKWLVALWMLVNCKNGVSSYEIHRDLGVTQKTAWFMLHRLRLALQDKSKGKFGGSGSEVEVDETFVGQKARNMHKSKKLRINQARNETPDYKGTVSSRYMGKTPVVGMLDREQRKIRATVVPNVRRETLQAKILGEVEHGSKVYTDSAVVYGHALADKFVHEIVNHVEGYVKGRVHTNGMENFWSLLKRSLNGSYVAVEPFHLFRYVDEQVFRYNNRGSKDEPICDADRFQLALSQVAGRRLTYAEVTGK
jgi:transposase-like protein